MEDTWADAMVIAGKAVVAARNYCCKAPVDAGWVASSVVTVVAERRTPGWLSWG